MKNNPKNKTKHKPKNNYKHKETFPFIRPSSPPPLIGPGIASHVRCNGRRANPLLGHPDRAIPCLTKKTHKKGKTLSLKQLLRHFQAFLSSYKAIQINSIYMCILNIYIYKNMFIYKWVNKQICKTKMPSKILFL